MDNFLLGLQVSAKLFPEHVMAAFQSPFFQGLLAGFVGATIVYAGITWNTSRESHI